jgi:hypothetical protein
MSNPVTEFMVEFFVPASLSASLTDNSLGMPSVLSPAPVPCGSMCSPTGLGAGENAAGKLDVLIWTFWAQGFGLSAQFLINLVQHCIIEVGAVMCSVPGSILSRKCTDKTVLPCLSEDEMVNQAKLCSLLPGTF